jgi:hypothetical protein
MSLRVATLFLALAVSGAALAQDSDPPGRVGRLSLVQGEVLVQAAEAGAPEQAVLNHPVTISDRLMTESASRAELSLGTAAVRLDRHTDLTIVNLDHDIAQIELNSGTLGIHLRELGEAETFEIDTPNAAVLLLQPGDYRIEVDSQGATVLAVRNGEAELDGGAGPTRVRDQQELRFVGPDQYASVQPLRPLDDFDQWCMERERRLADAQSTRYLSRDVVGYEDLDSYGSWWSEPGYGTVWAPTITTANWSPYRYGHWVWISPWGFTWVDHSPWGFAPFHYGRWAYLRHRWCWVPPRHHHRPMWAPALVAWDASPNTRDLRQAPVSWLPLGPRDVYVPQHRASARYLRNVNVSNTTIARNADITNAARHRVRNVRFANRDAPGAVSTMPAAAFDTDRAPALQTRLAAGGRMTVPRTPTDRRAMQFTGDPRRMNHGVAGFERPPGKEPQVAGEVGRERRVARSAPRQPSHARTAPSLRSAPMVRQNPTSRGNAATPKAPAARSTPAHRNDSGARSDGGKRAGSSGRSNASAPRAQSGRTGGPTSRP